MSPAELERQAQALYEANTIVAPLWRQLGDATKGYWRDRVMADLYADLA